jgi:hypothetical protein
LGFWEVVTQNGEDAKVYYIIQKAFERASFVRHFPNFKYLYKNKNKLNQEIVRKILPLAIEDKASYTLKWMTYSQQSIINKIELIFEYKKMKRRYKDIS